MTNLQEIAIGMAALSSAFGSRPPFIEAVWNLVATEMIKTPTWSDAALIMTCSVVSERLHRTRSEPPFTEPVGNPRVSHR